MLPVTGGGERAGLPVVTYARTRSWVAAINGIARSSLCLDEPQILELENVFWLPRVTALYRSDGSRIDETCIRRGADLSWIFNGGSETVAIPDDYATIDEPVVYVGFIRNHWGHFLTESISRLWALMRYPELRKLDLFAMPEANLHENIISFLDAVGLVEAGQSGAGVKGARRGPRPIRISKCYVPLPSFFNRSHAHSVHSLLPRYVASQLLKEPPVTDTRPLLLSRSKFGGNRAVRGEARLDDLCGQHGAVIVHPQELTMLDQIRLVNTHRKFIGCWGSALHNLIFRLPGERAQTHTLCDEFPPISFPLFDALSESKSYIAQCLESTAGVEQVWPALDLSFNEANFAQYAGAEALFTS